MDFTPNFGFCCPFIERCPSKSAYESRISKFMAWVKLQPANPHHLRRYTTVSTVALLKDQPFVIKIVEKGYAFMFHGAFAPRDGEGDIGGFDRILYFELATSDFQELQFEGEASEVFVCDKHEKRFLLSLYMKSPGVMSPYCKELRMTASTSAILESCGVEAKATVPVALDNPIETGKEDGGDKSGVVRKDSNLNCVTGHESQVLPSDRDSNNDFWN